MGNTKRKKEEEEILEKENKNDDPTPLMKSRHFYKACLSSDDNAEKNRQVLMDRLAVWGGWPIATENWNESKFDWKKLLIELLRTNDLAPLISIEISINDSSKTAILVDQAKILFCTDLKPIGFIDENNMKAHAHWIVKTARAIAKVFNEKVSEEKILKDVEDLLVLQLLLCEIQKPLSDRQNEFHLYNPRTIEQLQNLSDKAQPLNEHSKINWLTLIRDYLEGSGIEIDEDYEIILVEREYLSKFISVIDNHSARTLANYILWQKIAHLHGDISKEFRDMGYEYNLKVHGITNEERRWKVCADYITVDLGHAIGYEYVKLFFAKDEKKKAKELVTDILESFIEDLKEIDWMDANTRSIAVEKAKNIAIEVGYPSWYNMNNTTTLEDRYSHIIIGDSHLVNIENLKMGSFLSSVRTLGKPFDRTILFPSPAVVNALYLPPVNVMCIPAGIFQPPFYVKDRPEAMNYGAVGFIIGHEISHAFDVLQGRLADKFGNLAQWWDQSTLATYNIKQECVRQQYKEYPLPEIATDRFKVEHLDGDLTVSENIADNGGLKQAFEAYKRYVKKRGAEGRLPGLREYSPEKLFFLGFATVWCETSTPQSMVKDVMTDVHSPSKYRVLIPLGNSKEFAKTWNCRETDDSKMKLSRCCQFW